MKLAGWILSVLVVAFLCITSVMGKFFQWEGKTEMFQHLGYTQEIITKIGILEIVLALMFLIPRTGFIGAILLTAYLGGAVATHVRVGDPFYFPIIVGVLVWIGLGLRQPTIYSLALGGPKPGTLD